MDLPAVRENHAIVKPTDRKPTRVIKIPAKQICFRRSAWRWEVKSHHHHCGVPQAEFSRGRSYRPCCYPSTLVTCLGHRAGPLSRRHRTVFTRSWNPRLITWRLQKAADDLKDWLLAWRIAVNVPDRNIYIFGQEWSEVPGSYSRRKIYLEEADGVCQKKRRRSTLHQTLQRWWSNRHRHTKKTP